MRGLILRLHCIYLAAPYAKLPVSFSCMFLLALYQFSHSARVPAALEINRKDQTINEEHETDTEEQDEVCLACGEVD